MFLRIILVIVLFAAPAFAQKADTPKSLGVFGAWNAYVIGENGQHVCYMVTKAHPAKSKTRRGPAWLTITHRPAENSKDVISYTSGYNFKGGSDVTVHIGKSDFALFTEKDTAWSRDSRTDHMLAAAIQKNASMTVSGFPAARGAKVVTDTLDLKGATAAYRAIGKACGLAVKDAPKPAAVRKKSVK